MSSANSTQRGRKPTEARSGNFSGTTTVDQSSRVPSAIVPHPRSKDPFEGLEDGINQQGPPPEIADFLRDIDLEVLNVDELNALIEKGNQLSSAYGPEVIRQRMARLYYQLGIRHQNESSLSQAFVNISAAIDRDSLEPEYLYARANIFARSQRYDAGAADLNRAIALDPQRGDLHWAKGVIYLLASRTPGGSDQLKAAIEAFTTAIGCNPRAAKYFSSRGAAYSRIGEPFAALADLDSALRLDPTDAKTYYNRGHLRHRQGNDSGAAEDLRRAAELGSAEAAADLRRHLVEEGRIRH